MLTNMTMASKSGTTFITNSHGKLNLKELNYKCKGCTLRQLSQGPATQSHGKGNAVKFHILLGPRL